MDGFNIKAYLNTGWQYAFMLSWLPSIIMIGAADAGSIGSGHPHILGAVFGIIFFSSLYYGYIFFVRNWSIRRFNTLILLSFNIALFFILPVFLKVEANVVAFSVIFASIPGIPLLFFSIYRHVDSIRGLSKNFA